MDPTFSNSFDLLTSSLAASVLNGRVVDCERSNLGHLVTSPPHIRLGASAWCSGPRCPVESLHFASCGTYTVPSGLEPTTTTACMRLKRGSYQLSYGSSEWPHRKQRLEHTATSQPLLRATRSALRGRYELRATSLVLRNGCELAHLQTSRIGYLLYFLLPLFFCWLSFIIILLLLEYLVPNA